MLAWPANGEKAIANFEGAIRAQRGVTSVSSRVFIPIYLADGLNVPNGSGFYVHREEHYASENVDEAVRLSREAWKTWEPAWGVRVAGLFRERPDPSGFANLIRIAWYPSYKVWLDTRRLEGDPESAKRFSKRAKLELGGSGVAIATDRLVP
jgi:hypothetical protein